ncbi:MAG: hypothetical protein ABIT47_00540 [Candidatus Paceibacterota bacterium]
MTSAILHSEPEPTLREVANTVETIVHTVSDLGLMLFDMLKAMKNGFYSLEYQITDLQIDVSELKIDMSIVKTGVDELNHRVGTLEVSVEDLREDVQGLAKAVDKDAITLIDHGRRIVSLERAP